MASDLTVQTIVNGEGAGSSDLNAFAVDPVAALTGADVSGSDAENPGDRRTFLLIRNASGSHSIAPFFYNDAIYRGWLLKKGYTLEGETPDVPLNAFGFFGGLLEDGKSKLYGPFPQLWFPDSVRFIPYNVGTGNPDSTGISVAAFYLSTADELANSGQTGAGESVVIPVAAGAADLARQTITLNGLEVSFTDHDTQNDGFGLKVRNDAGSFTDGGRRFLWLRNNSGCDDVLLLAQGWGRQESGGSVLAPWVTAADDLVARSSWAVLKIDDGEEFFVGPWDARAWYMGGSYGGVDMTDSLSLRALSSGSPTYTPGTTSGLDMAWLELPV